MNHLFASPASVLSDKLTVGHLVTLIGLVSTALAVIYGRRYITNLKMSIATLVAGVVTLASWFGISEYQAMQFDAKAKDYLLAAYKTDDQEKAKKYLDKALDYLHETGADSGHSAVFAGGQTDDLGEYASDLKKIRDEMNSPRPSTEVVSADTPSYADLDTPKEKNSATPVNYKQRMAELGFIRLDGENKPHVNYPIGMKLAPYNFHYAMWLAAGLLLSLAGAGLTTTRILQDRRGKGRVVCRECKGKGYCKAAPTA